MLLHQNLHVGWLQIKSGINMLLMLEWLLYSLPENSITHTILEIKIGSSDVLTDVSHYFHLNLSHHGWCILGGKRGLKRKRTKRGIFSLSHFGIFFVTDSKFCSHCDVRRRREARKLGGGSSTDFPCLTEEILNSREKQEKERERDEKLSTRLSKPGSFRSSQA